MCIRDRCSPTPAKISTFASAGGHCLSLCAVSRVRAVAVIWPLAARFATVHPTHTTATEHDRQRAKFVAQFAGFVDVYKRQGLWCPFGPCVRRWPQADRFALLHQFGVVAVGSYWKG